MKRQPAQGGLEYLLLIGGAIVVAAVVVAMLLQISSSGSEPAKIAVSSVEAKKQLVYVGIPQSSLVRYFNGESAAGAVGPVTVVQDTPRGRVLDFGTNGYIVHSTSGMDSRRGTLSAWVKPTLASGTWGIWQTHDDRRQDFPDWIAMFRYSDNNPLIFRLGNGSGSNPNSQMLYNTINQWDHFAFTWNDDDKTAKIYLNGQKIPASEITNITLQSRMDSYARLGYAYAASVQGRMDDVMIFNIALSEAQIAKLYAAQVK